MLRFLFLVFLLEVSSSSRIIDRFGGSYRKDLTCRILQMDILRLRSQVSFALGQYLQSALLDMLAKVNCSFLYEHYVDTGLPDEYGNYSGFIGMIQRQEAEILGGLVVRPDSLPFEPGKIGPVVMEADVTIVSKKNDSKPVHREIASFVEDFDPVTYFYILIILIVFAIFATIIDIALSTNPDITLDAAYMFLDVLKDTFMLVVDQENFAASRWSSRLLTVSLSIFVMIFIQGLFLNQVGSDLVVNRTPPQIDSLSFFINKDYNNWTKPVVVKKYYLMSLLMNSNPESELGKLWKIITAHPNESILDVDMNKGQQGIAQVVWQLFEDVNNCTKALIFPKAFVGAAQRSGCVVQPKLIKDAYVARESFAAGTLTLLMSNGIHPYIRKYFEYNIRTTVETGFLKGGLQLLDPNLPGISSGLYQYGIEALACQEGKSSQPSEDEWRPFSVKDLKKVFLMLIFGFAFGAVLYVIEDLCKVTRYWIEMLYSSPNHPSRKISAIEELDETLDD